MGPRMMSNRVSMLLLCLLAFCACGFLGSLWLQGTPLHSQARLINHFLPILKTLHQVDKDAPRQTIIVTSWRSGSSFTGSILSIDPDVFFSFEPLQIFEPYADYYNRENKKDLYVRTIDRMLKCEFYEVPPRVFTTSMMYLSNNTKEAFACFLKNTTAESHLECYNRLIKSCQNSSTRFIKTVRFRLVWAEQLLQRHPNLKIIFLVRDPRPTVKSQMEHWIIKTIKTDEDLTNYSSYHCQELESNLKALASLSALYPGRLMGIRYEDGALYPQEFARALYQFAGLKFTSEVREHIHHLTHSTRPDMPFEVTRRDSKKAMNSWKTETSLSYVKLIDTICGNVYPPLGYREMTEEQLRSNDTLLDKPRLSEFAEIA